MTAAEAATVAGLHVIYRAPDYLAVEAVCAFLAFMGNGCVHARVMADGLQACLCGECSAGRGETSHEVVFVRKI